MAEPYYGWALDAVEGLRWLAAIDDWAFAGERENLGGRDPRVMDVAHVRWASTTAKTAIDLCSIELAYRYGDHEFWAKRAQNFFEVRKTLKPDDPRTKERVTTWLDGVNNDPDFAVLSKIRNALTHQFLVRTAPIVIRAPRGHEERTRFEIDPTAPAKERPDARELILKCCHLAERHVSHFEERFGSRPSPSPPRPSQSS